MFLLFMVIFATGNASETPALPLPVSVAILEDGKTRSTWRTYGGMTLAARATDLGFKHGGEIVSVAVDWGDRVESGAVLARLRPESFQAAVNSAVADVAVAQAALAAATAELEIAQKAERRFGDLREKGHVSSHQHDETISELRARLAHRGVAEANLKRSKAQEKSARIALDESRIVAPFAGTIQTRMRDEGTQIRPGEPVLRLVDTETIEARFGIPDTSAALIGASPRFEIQWQGNPVVAALVAVLPEVDPVSRTQTAIFRLEEPAVPPGAVVELRLPHQWEINGFWVPVAALTEAERGLWSVYVVNADNITERRLVEVLHSESTDAFVRGTVQAGEKLVSSGVNRIVPGQHVQIVDNGTVTGR